MEIADTGDQPTGLAGATESFLGLLTAEDGDNGQSDENQEHSEEEHSKDEAAQADAGEGEDGKADAEGDETPPEGEDAEGEGDADEEKAADGSDQKPQTLTVKIDGKEVEVPLEEAAKGYQRQADYSRKTAELAEQRRTFETKVADFNAEREAVVQERGQYAHLLRALEQRLQELTPQEPDWVTLAQQMDPAEYTKTRAVWEAVKEQRKAAEDERKRVDELNQKETARQFQAKVAQGRATLLEYQPEWKDGKKWDADRREIFDYAVNRLGFTPQEIANATDARAIMAVHKAMLYDKVMANKPVAQKKAAAQKSPKPLSAGAAGNVASAPQVTKAKQRLAKTGRVADAAAVFENLL